jgi:hypothetical protein
MLQTATGSLAVFVTLDVTPTLSHFARLLWIKFVKLNRDTLPESQIAAVERIHQEFEKLSWHEVLDFIEYLAANSEGPLHDEFVEECNSVLVGGHEILNAGGQRVERWRP